MKKTRYRLKAEWEEQIAILMAFPHKNSDWAAHIEEARECFMCLIEQILSFEAVILCVDTDDEEGIALLSAHFKEHIALAQNKDSQSHQQYGLHIVRVPLNDTWARDFGGISVEAEGGEGIVLFDFIFNGWGLKYPANYDNHITQNIVQQVHKSILSPLVESIFAPHRIIKADMVLEGGSIESNGAGVLLTNTQCLLESHRNPHLNQQEIESRLKEYFGLDSVLWLTQGYLAGDDTDSHIDTLARFIAPDSIAYIVCEDKEDEHFEALTRMQEELRALRQPSGEPYKLIALPFTQAIYDEQGQRLPASYANFLFVNGGLLVPTYGDKNDKKALEILSKALPKHRVVGVDCRSLILWHGSLHCVSMQLYIS
ncbi:agmatine deiminase family protein [Helicobacter sp. MIT 21-1697]|uniref:agmatine deiminase family protein n=1 Tax=Helicobacter sp. MIT 21-1697 TaxID=2993733 RepID=UPI00224A6597|nr:agmatine deiminase family protein [Helicobacter sp. MIT 21-1697]MCX2716639.1 agmatine deiminase family protein [Helicobacter sp. MIT 21-1697]